MIILAGIYRAKQGRENMKIRSLRVCLLLLALVLSGWVNAQVELNDGAPETYVVKKGDTLWGISGMYLQKPWL